MSRNLKNHAEVKFVFISSVQLPQMIVDTAALCQISDSRTLAVKRYSRGSREAK